MKLWTSSPEKGWLDRGAELRSWSHEKLGCTRVHKLTQGLDRGRTISEPVARPIAMKVAMDRTSSCDHEHDRKMSISTRSQRWLRKSTSITMRRESHQRESSIATMFANNHFDRDDDRDSSITIVTVIARAIDSITTVIEEHDVRAYERSRRSTRGDSYDRNNQPMRLIAVKSQKSQFDRDESLTNKLVCSRWSSRTSTQIAMTIAYKQFDRDEGRLNEQVRSQWRLRLIASIVWMLVNEKVWLRRWSLKQLISLAIVITSERAVCAGVPPCWRQRPMTTIEARRLARSCQLIDRLIIDHPWRWGSPEKKQQSTSLWLLLCAAFGLSARIPALAIHTRLVESGWTQQSNRSVFGNDRMITNKNESNNLDGDDVASRQCVLWWLIWQSTSKQKRSRQSSCWWLLLCLFGHGEREFSEAEHSTLIRIGFQTWNARCYVQMIFALHFYVQCLIAFRHWVQ